jgi:Zn-dependent protease with chaperone function
MNKDDFHRLVRRLEKECAASPRVYRLKVIGLASLGYLYIVLISSLAIGGLLWALVHLAQGRWLDAVQVGLLAAFVSLFVAPALWVKIPQPQGRILQESDAPRLFALLSKIQRKSGGERIDQVILNDMFNTAIVQMPRLGILGWHRNVLIIGMPLLQALSRKEFAAIVAHEHGHLSRRHGKLSTWIYRIRTMWTDIYESFGQNDGFGKLLLTRPLRWYIPFFNAYSFVLARRDEYEADRLAAKLVGPRTLADALIAIAVRRRFIEERFWPDLWARADRQGTPPFLPHCSMRTALHVGLSEEQAEAWLSEEMRRDTASDDTHPCLRDRILALDTSCELPPESVQSAAQSLLGERLAEFQRDFDALWLQYNEVRWREHFQVVSAARGVVEQFEARDLASLRPTHLSQYALALETLGRLDEALPLLRMAADHPHGSAVAALAAARILHARGDEATIIYLELAMKRDKALSEEAVTQAAAFYESCGQREKARSYWGRLESLKAA